jgi:hypothetical protein
MYNDLMQNNKRKKRAREKKYVNWKYLIRKKNGTSTSINDEKKNEMKNFLDKQRKEKHGFIFIFFTCTKKE